MLHQLTTECYQSSGIPIKFHGMEQPTALQQTALFSELLKKTSKFVKRDVRSIFSLFQFQICSFASSNQFTICEHCCFIIRAMIAWRCCDCGQRRANLSSLQVSSTADFWSLFLAHALSIILLCYWLTDDNYSMVVFQDPNWIEPVVPVAAVPAAEEKKE